MSDKVKNLLLICNSLNAIKYCNLPLTVMDHIHTAEISLHAAVKELENQKEKDTP